MAAPAKKVVLKPFELVVAQTKYRGIGNKGVLPWPRLPLDMGAFVKHTTECAEGKVNAVIMGRKTYESIPAAHRPLKNRLNIIISTQDNLYPPQDDLIVVKSFDAAHVLASQHPNVDKLVIIGGVSLFNIALKSLYCQTIHLTEIYKHFDCDVFMPPIDPHQFDIVQCGDVLMDGLQHDVPIQFSTLKRKINAIHPPAVGTPEYYGEQGYLDLIRNILENGQTCTDRTGVGTKSLWGAHIRYNLRNGSFPLFTTKRTFYRGILEELLWFIRGSTNANELKDKGVHIWDGNSTREFLDKRGLVNNVEGDLGPVYGFQWRHFGADYVDYKTDYTGKGVDQLAYVINEIKTNPDSRRIIMSAWCPPAIDNMALPPCHVLSQFRVYNGELHCVLYSRSNDVCLGTPFNVGSYALMTYMIAHVCGLVPGELVHFMADCHVYLNHVEPIKAQLERIPQQQPTLTIKRPYNPDAAADDQTVIRCIDDFVYDDFVLEGYTPDAAIKMDMAV